MLPLDIKDCVLLVIRILPPEVWVKVANIMWCVWKARNSEVLEGVLVRPRKVLMEANAIASTGGRRAQESVREVQQYGVPRQNWVVLVDSSWDTSGRAGVAWVVYGSDDKAVIAVAAPVQAVTAFQSEALALLQALKWIEVEGQLLHNGGFTMFTDCKTLRTIVKEGTHYEAPSWQAVENLAHIEKVRREIAASVEVEYMQREGIKVAHQWANKARADQIEYMENIAGARLDGRAGLGDYGRIAWARES